MVSRKIRVKKDKAGKSRKEQYGIFEKVYNENVSLYPWLDRQKLRNHVYKDTKYEHTTEGVIQSIILSSNNEIKIPEDYCFAAEIGLSGEIRPVQRIEQRIKEAEKENRVRENERQRIKEQEEQERILEKKIESERNEKLKNDLKKESEEEERIKEVEKERKEEQEEQENFLVILKRKLRKKDMKKKRKNEEKLKKKNFRGLLKMRIKERNLRKKERKRN